MMYLKDLLKMEKKLKKAIKFVDQFSSPISPWYALWTYKPDLVHSLAGVRRAIAQAQINDTTRSVLPILAGLAHNQFFPANLLNAEYTVALRWEENKGTADAAKWKEGWGHIHGPAKCFRKMIAKAYSDLGL